MYMDVLLSVQRRRLPGAVLSIYSSYNWDAGAPRAKTFAMPAWGGREPGFFPCVDNVLKSLAHQMAVVLSI